MLTAAVALRRYPPHSLPTPRLQPRGKRQPVVVGINVTPVGIGTLGCSEEGNFGASNSIVIQHSCGRVGHRTAKKWYSSVLRHQGCGTVKRPGDPRSSLLSGQNALLCSSPVCFALLCSAPLAPSRSTLIQSTELHSDLFCAVLSRCHH